MILVGKTGEGGKNLRVDVNRLADAPASAPDPVLKTVAMRTRWPTLTYRSALVSVIVLPVGKYPDGRERIGDLLTSLVKPGHNPR